MWFARFFVAVVHLPYSSFRIAEDSCHFGTLLGIRKLCEGQLSGPLQAVDSLSRQGLQVSTNILCCILHDCIKNEDLTAGRAVYCYVIKSDLTLNTLLGTSLIRMFAACGSLVDAQKVFSELPEPNVFTWSTIILAHAKLGQSEHAIRLYHQIAKQSSLKPDGHVFVAVLKACTSTASLAHGQLIHSHSMECDFKSDLFVGNTLIDMYLKCDSLNDARMVFEQLSKRDVVTWSVMMMGCSEQGHAHEALQLFQQMQEEGMEPDKVTFICILKACSKLTALHQGKLIHAHIIESRFESDVSVGNTLVDMYAKCGSLADAWGAFYHLVNQDVVTWNALIAGYSSHENGDTAFELFQQMLHQGIQPNQATFVSMLRVCACAATLCLGQVIHVYIKESGFDLDTSVGNSLINMYCKFGCFEDAFRAFDALSTPNAVSWNAMIAGCSQHDHVQKACELFLQMSQNGIKPDVVSYVSILRLCFSSSVLHKAKLIHHHIIEGGFDLNVRIANSLIDAYVKCETLDDACWVFERSSKQDVITWSTLIGGYCQHEHCQEALYLFWHMQQDCVEPDQVTLVCVLKALSGIAGLHQGKLIHVQILETGCDLDIVVTNTVIDMYAKCGSLKAACTVFDRMPVKNVVTWNAMIAGYVDHGHYHKAWLLLLKMQEKNIKPNQVTCACILRTCSGIADLHTGKLIHCYVIENGFGSDTFAGNALIDMYTKCESIKDAQWVFERLSNRDIITWNAMISGCAIHVSGQGALPHFQQMLQDGMEPNQATFVCALKACVSMLSLQQGKLIHSYIIHYGFEFDILIGNTLIDLYAKFGSLEDAHTLFDKLSKQDVVTWGAMMAGCAQHSHYKLALQHFEDMQQRGLKPNEVIFGCVLSACCHLGLLDEGYCHFKSMSEHYGISPTLNHYNYMVDLLGRAGCLIEAEDLLQSMPFGPNIVGWMSLISNCQNHGNLRLGQRCFDHLLTAELKKAGGYMLMSNIYVHAGIQEEAYKVEEMRKNANAWKVPGKVTIEVANEVHNFVVGCTQHPQSDNVYAKLNYLSFQMKKVGYMPCVDLVLKFMPDENKETVLIGHCESGGN